MAKLEENNRCKRCGGIMLVERKTKHIQLWTLIFIGIAIALGFTGIGLIIVIPLGLIGLYLVAVAHENCLCRTCRTIPQVT